MNKRIYTTLVFIAAFAILFWWLWRTGSRRQVVREPKGKATATSTASRLPTGEQITAEDLARIPGSGTDDEKRLRILELRQIMNQANQPVDFWGKVIDQDGAPLSGVEIKISLRYARELAPGAMREDFSYFVRTSDSRGIFSVTGEKGSLLGIKEMTKEGYEASNFGSRAYWFAPPLVTMQFTSDKTKPEIFRIWKKIGAERLVNKGFGTRIPYDGQSVNFDLLTGQELTSGGDVRVTLTRTPLQIKRGQQKYDWTATIEAIDGGIIVSTDEFMYRAPEVGYESKVTISVLANDQQWSSDKDISFYLKSRGRYSRVKAAFMTDSEKPKTGFRIEAYTNPNGSRNLEYDPLQNVVKSPSASKP